MIKYIKKFTNIILAFILIFASLIVPTNGVHAKTIGDLKKELDQLQSEYNEAKNEKQQTQEEINNTQSNINSTMSEIAGIEKTIEDLNNEIEQKKADMLVMEQQIKDIMSFYQVSNGESAYLEYAFGAKTFTDYIYRTAISEQLTRYNDELIDSYNKKIEENKQKSIELDKKSDELENKQVSLKGQLSSLGTKLTDIVEDVQDIGDEVAAQKAVINMYVTQYKCKDTDSIESCTKGSLPADTKFWRPLSSGRVTSEFGNRFHPTKKTWTLHTGTDMSTSGSNVPVYAAASGVVAHLVYKSSCGGNTIYIHHKINGKTYTTVYMHLRSMLVSKGQVVTKDTQVGVMGGSPSIETWDKCSTGAHLHFSIANGLYLSDYSSYSTFVSKLINPRTMVNIPSGNKFWSNRTTKY